MMTRPPFLIVTTSVDAWIGFSSPIEERHDRRRNQPVHQRRNEQREETREGHDAACHAMSVVMSPNGLKAPPALAATTTLMQATTTNFGRSRPTASATAPMIRAVVRLSAIGEMTNASPPVIQKIARRLKPRLASHARRAAKTPRSPSVFTKVIAASRNSISSA